MVTLTTPKGKRASDAGAEGTYVALLRGINVGGKHSLPMKSLAARFEGAGCADVVTYIQSGNVVFKAEAALAARIPKLVGKAIADDFGFEVPIVLRSADELRSVAGRNPYLREDAATDVAHLHVVFLAAEPGAHALTALDPSRSPPDRFTVSGREVYLYCPNGYGNTKLTTGYFDAKLATVSTVRNWKTVLKLLALATA